MTAQGTGERVLRSSVPTVRTAAQLAEVVEHYSGLDEFVVDVETMGDRRIDPRLNRVVWIGLACQGRADLIPLGHPNGELVEVRRGVLPGGVLRLQEGKDLLKSSLSKRTRNVFGEPPEQLTPAEVFEALRPLFFSERRKIGANVKFDLESIAKYYGGEVPPPEYGDVIIGDFLLDDTQMNYGLAHLCKRRLGYEMPKGVGKEIEAHSFSDVAHYLHGDVRFTWLLWRQIQAQLDKTGLASVFRLEMDCLRVVMEMEQAGTRVDTDAMTTLGEELAKGINDATARAYSAAGEKFNVNSNADKQRLLFEVRGLTPKVFTGKTNAPSTSEEALKHHRKDPLVQALLEIAEIRKLQSTYVIPYLGGEVTRTTAGKARTEVRESLLVNGRVHASFKQHGARTGRMSCTNPNLQNIPARGDYGPRIRSMFIADPDCQLIVADYCLAPGQRLWTSDNTWVPVEDVQVGDSLVGFNENPVGKGVRRKLEHTLVLGTKELSKPCYRIHLEDGTSVVSSVDHLWIADGTNEYDAISGAYKGSKTPCWVRTDALVPGESRLKRIVSPWDTDALPISEHERGWLAGIWDGEGWCSPRIAGIAQNPGDVWDKLVDLLDRLGMQYQIRRNNSGVSQVIFTRRSEVIRLAGILEPRRIAPKLREQLTGFAVGGRYMHSLRVLRVEDLGLQRVIAVQTQSRTFIAEGLLSHNCQIEPRVMASFSGDQTMIGAFIEGRDIYQAIADRLNVTRHAGKTLILAMAYGIGPEKIGRDLGMGITAARNLLDEFAKQFPDLMRYKDSVIRKAETRRPVPYVTTVLGRRRRIPDLRSNNPEFRGRGRRQAFNAVIQGSAADVLKLALVRAQHLLPDGAQILLTVHDEIVVQAPLGLVEDASEALRTAMEGINLPQIKVPLKVDLGVGLNWKEAK